MMKLIAKAVAILWQHRTSYVLLALAYGAASTGLVDKDLCSSIAAVAYGVMIAQKH